MIKLILPLVSIIVVAVISAALSYCFELCYWPVFAIVAAAILVNGVVATIEDDVPGGFNNSDGKDTPKYVLMIQWAAKAGIYLFIGLSVFVLVLWIIGRESSA